jgi:hypothetical protein
MSTKYIIKLVFGVLVALYVFCSCDKPHELNLGPHQPRLVVHAYVATGDFFEVAVGRTLPAVGVIPPDSNIAISDALVVLFENGVRRDTLQYDKRELVYRSSSVTAITGNEYKVMVEAAGFPGVEAIATAPSLVPLTLVKFRKNARVDDLGRSLDDVTVRFTDPLLTRNFYRVELNRNKIYGSTGFCVYTYDPIIEQYQENLSPFESGSCIISTAVLFTDATFSGSEKEITLSGSSDDLAEYEYRNVIHRPYLKTYNISQELYDYIKDGISLDIVQNNPFAQPFPIKGNVRNGYGMFTIFAVTTDTLR